MAFFIYVRKNLERPECVKFALPIYNLEKIEPFSFRFKFRKQEVIFKKSVVMSQRIKVLLNLGLAKDSGNPGLANCRF
jgi:hypothetical protein